ncbi:hypothetical protein BJ912DRAFT_992797 [Pholiota molesta]|nr:hypothetical protein BJ912DRAFT_992797 [Pholiota molesta]
MGAWSEAETYNEDALPASLKEIRAAIPAEFFIRDTRRGLLYLARDLLLAATAWTLATYIDPYFQSAATKEALGPIGAEVGRWAAWGVYWWFQGLIFTGIWVIGHECGHGAYSDHKIVNDVIGFITHSFLWTPYFSWRISHHRHHSNHASMERDEVYVPKTREDLGIPEKPNHEIDWDELFGDTPIYTLYMLIRQQVLAFPAYLLFNVSGQKTYPKWTNHFDPNSILFTKAQRNAVIMSNIGIALMVWGVTYACTVYGVADVSHWFIMITYLHHTDPTLPHYRGKEWNFQRGAAAPLHHGPEATQHLKAFIGDHYASSDKPSSRLWDSYNQCQFVENQGEVLFYRDKKGQALRRPPTNTGSRPSEASRLNEGRTGIVMSSKGLFVYEPFRVYIALECKMRS